MKVRVTADSTCDLSAELKEKYDIAIAPLTVLLGDDAYHDGMDVTPAQIVAAVEAGKTCKTAAVNTYEYTKLFQHVLKDCDAVVHLCIGKKFSSCYADACQAAQAVGNVYVVNTASLSTGMGLMVLDAAEMAQRGASPEEIVAAMEAERPLVDGSFVLDQVDYLRNGGRCSSVTAVGAKLLHIKPCIELEDGAMTVGKKYRGSFQRCLEHYIQDKLERREEIDFSRAFLVHNLCAPGVVEHVQSYLIATANFRELYVVPAGSTICCHCGPSTLGLMFKRKTAKERK